MSAAAADLVRAIRSAASARELHTLRTVDLAREDVTPAERSRLGALINKRFSELNSAAQRPAFPRGRW